MRIEGYFMQHLEGADLSRAALAAGHGAKIVCGAAHYGSLSVPAYLLEPARHIQSHCPFNPYDARWYELHNQTSRRRNDGRKFLPCFQNRCGATYRVEDYIFTT